MGGEFTEISSAGRNFKVGGMSKGVEMINLSVSNLRSIFPFPQSIV